MKTFKVIMQALMLCFIAYGCSSDNDDDGNKPVVPENTDNVPTQKSDEPTPVAEPNWYVDFSMPGSEVGVPDWEAPKYNLFELNMTAIVMVPMPVGSFESKDDIMAAFINGECRGVTTPSVLSDIICYPLFIRSNPQDPTDVTLKYYSTELKQVFTAENVFQFSPENSIGSGMPLYVDALNVGGPKYKTVLEDVSVELDLPFEPKVEDKIAVIVDGECRAFYETGTIKPSFYCIMGKNENEQFYIEYYRKENSGLYRSQETYPINKKVEEYKATMLPVVSK